jgi:competence protein ComFA
LKQCPRCHNTNQHGFFKLNEQEFCRFCLSYAQRIEQYTKKREISLNEEDFGLSFDLTINQSKVSDQISNTIKSSSVLVEAVCGAGKTELVVQSVGNALMENRKVGWAIPRRQVVLQLKDRLQKIFPTLKVIAVCEGHTSVFEGDLIICTTHQLFRYEQYFDLLILDEPDAFPYKGDAMLEAFANNSVKGHIIYLTATPSKEQKMLIKHGKIAHITLFQRPFNNKLPVPKKIISLSVYLYLWLMMYLRKTEHQTMIFVPTIKKALLLSKVLNLVCVTSKTENKEEVIQKFIDKKLKHLVCTTVLERGVTFSNIHVVVLNANHVVFDESSLIQISGRVGRDKKYPTGACFFLMNEQSKEVDKCIKEIEKANKFAFGA